jgi:hypothetical protein
MVKVVMVRLDGTSADEARLAAVESIAHLFSDPYIGAMSR